MVAELVSCMGCLPVDELIIGHGAGQGSGAVPLPQLSPDLRETLVSCLGHSTFLQHVIADIAEDLKLLNAGQGVGIVTL